MAVPEHMNDLRESSQLGFGVYSWLKLVSAWYVRSIWDI